MVIKLRVAMIVVKCCFIFRKTSKLQYKAKGHYYSKTLILFKSHPIKSNQATSNLILNHFEITKALRYFIKKI